MDNIDILEEFIKINFLYGKISFTDEQFKKYQQAILNLITENKELKEKNKKIKQEYINPNKARISYFDYKKRTNVVIEGFIPKLKVEEIIKELDKTDSKISKSLFNDDCGTWTKAIQNLLKRELLEE